MTDSVMVAERDALAQQVIDLQNQMFKERGTWQSFHAQQTKRADIAEGERDALAARVAQLERTHDVYRDLCIDHEKAADKAEASLAAAHGLQARAERAEAALEALAETQLAARTMVDLIRARRAFSARARRAEHERDALLDALRPFAAEADRYGTAPDNTVCKDSAITAGDLRRARAALAAVPS